MWVFMNDAFFSAVEHEKNPDWVMVRARMEGDLERAFQVNSSEVLETSDSDYRFRITVTKDELNAAIISYVSNYLDYTNFKNSIPKEDKARYKAYTGVWQEMLEYQEDVYGMSDMWTKYLGERYGDDTVSRVEVQENSGYYGSGTYSSPKQSVQGVKSKMIETSAQKEAKKYGEMLKKGA